MAYYVIDTCGIKRSAEYINCANCEESFLRQTKDIRNSKTGRHFCTPDCFRKSRAQNKVQLACGLCGFVFNRRKSSLKSKSGYYFCSLHCRNRAASLNGLEGFTPSHYGTAKRRKGVCSTCGAPTGSQSTICTEHKPDTYEEYIAKWHKGEVTGNQGDNESLHPKVRRYMFEKHDSECVKCGWSEVHPITGRIPLTVNHIDGNASNSTESNLELICPNCHSLTPNYGSLNKGNGRKQRAFKLRNPHSAPPMPT